MNSILHKNIFNLPRFKQIYKISNNKLTKFFLYQIHKLLKKLIKINIIIYNNIDKILIKIKIPFRNLHYILKNNKYLKTIHK